MTARVEIVPYQDAWPAAFSAIAAERHAALGALALRIDPAGSTSVPGRAAKDIIEIPASVARLDRDAVAAAVQGSVFRLESGFWDDHVPPAGHPSPDDWRKLRIRLAAGHR